MTEHHQWIGLNSYCSFHRRLFLSRCATTFLLIKTSKSLLILRRISWEGSGRSAAFLDRLGKVFFFKQLLNNFARIWDSSLFKAICRVWLTRWVITRTPTPYQNNTCVGIKKSSKFKYRYCTIFKKDHY